MNCTNCKFAIWQKMAGGNLHPSGNGRCGYEYKAAPLPVSMYWVGGRTPCGGSINRREEWPEDCVYFSTELGK